MVSPLPRPFRRPAAGPESIKSNGRSEHEYRLWLILPSHSHRSKYMTCFSQATYLLNILTVKLHFSDSQIRRKLTLFETFLCLRLFLCHYSLWCWTFSTRESLGQPRPLRRPEVYNFIPLAKPTVQYLSMSIFDLTILNSQQILYMTSHVVTTGS